MTAAWVFGAALAGLPGMSNQGLTGLLSAHGSAQAAWQAVRRGRAGGVWQSAAPAIDVDDVERRHVEAGVSVLLAGDDAYPARLLADHERPAVLFVRGQVGLVGSSPSVAIVGTRRCTHYGRGVAAELGRDLAAAGVCVVSGLALGIDGAAHEGSLSAGDAPPVAIVACGVDIVYPARHRSLWARMAETGALVSEVPLGVRPTAWRFPMRNRIIAALADVVVVVESNRAGGSMHTVAAATDRGTPVLAVPGPVRSPSSAGTNALLADGCAPARDAADVLVALELSGVAVGRTREGSSGPDPACAGPDLPVLEAVDWGPTTLDTIVMRTSLDVQRVAAALVRLEVAGLVVGDAGWWERQKPPSSRLHS